MPRVVLLLLVLVSFLGSTHARAAPLDEPAADVLQDTCRSPGRVALVLSGGGARGLAHIGVIQVLDSLGIRPDLVVGTSMGALVGSLYASGHNGAELDSMARALRLARLFTKPRPRAMAEFDGRPALVVLSNPYGRMAAKLSVVRDRRLNTLLTALLLSGNLTARGDFDSLPIPFRAVATDRERGESVALGREDLAQAVRASIALPFLLQPIRMEERWLGDGGLTENIPVPTALKLGADVLIVSAVGARRPAASARRPPVELANLAGDMFDQRVPTLPAGSVEVISDLGSFNQLDFSTRSVPALIAAGRAAARAAFSRKECEFQRDPPVAARPRALRLAAVEVVGTSQFENRRVGEALGLRPGDSIAPDRLQSELSRIGAAEVYDQLWLNPRGRPDSLTMSLQVLPIAPILTAGGLAYHSDLGLRGWAGIAARRLASGRLALSATAVAEQDSQQIELALRASPRRLTSPVPVASVRLARAEIGSSGPQASAAATIKSRDLRGFAGLERRWSEGASINVGAILRTWSIGPGTARWTTGLQATAATAASGALPRLHANAAWTPAFRRFDAGGEWPIALGRIRITQGLAAGWGHNLPPQDRFPLGGIMGFPGVRVGELNGERAAVGRTRLELRIAGPLNVALETAGGYLRTPADRDLWRLGLATGITMAESPVGPVEALCGIASSGRPRLLIRAGQW